MKECITCKEEKPVSEFSLTPSGNPRSKCKTCRSVENRGVAGRDRKLKQKYGISHNQYLSILEKQEGKCAICGEQAEDQHHGVLDVDHNHDTGGVRGLLCNPCNRALGMFGDNPGKILKAYEYLIKAGYYGA